MHYSNQGRPMNRWVFIYYIPYIQIIHQTKDNQMNTHLDKTGHNCFYIFNIWKQRILTFDSSLKITLHVLHLKVTNMIHSLHCCNSHSLQYKVTNGEYPKYWVSFYMVKQQWNHNVKNHIFMGIQKMECGSITWQIRFILTVNFPRPTIKCSTYFSRLEGTVMNGCH